MSWREKLQTFLHGAKQSSVPNADNIITKTLETSGNAAVAGSIWQRRYEAVRELGAGGMGRVLLAKRRSDSLLVCLKFVNPYTDRRTAEQECRALMRLRHPAIVALLDFSLEDTPPWLATEYIDGPTLRAYLKDRPPLTVEASLPILRQMLVTLDYAHGEGVIHRDLKPSNLMVEEIQGDPRVRFLDFGIAIIDEYDHEGRMTAQGSDPLGTLLYMAPEQLQGKLLTPACDIYAIGLIVWEMLTGNSAFARKTRSQMLFEKVTRPDGFALDQTHVPLSAGLRSFVEAATHPEPTARPSARDALAMLA